MSNHTKGPWRVADNPRSAGYPIVAPQRKRSGGTNRICSVLPAGWSPEAYAEAKANAYLIAAAPELLEALRLFDAYMAIPATRGGHASPRWQAREAFLAAKDAAIAKAEGETE